MEVNFLEYINGLTFYSPNWFWGLLLIPLMIFYYVMKRQRRQVRFKYSGITHLSKFRGKGRTVLLHVPFVFKLLGVALVFIALARPQTSLSWKDVETEGIDIVLVQDISLSMLAKDFKPDRLTAAKKLAGEFVDLRPNDRIGLVIFSGEGFTQCPLTTDHSVVKSLIKEVKVGLLQQGTAIGMGLATAVNRIKHSEAKSKVVVLLTDGENNVGKISPETAGELAKANGIRVYTIGVGTTGMALTPNGGIYPNGEFAFDYRPVDIDEPLMKKIAKETGGKYFRATNNASLRKVYEEIDKLEKSKIDVSEYRKKREEFFWFLFAGFLFLLLDFIVKELVLNGAE